jgi:hypothetical protein
MKQSAHMEPANYGLWKRGLSAITKYNGQQNAFILFEVKTVVKEIVVLFSFPFIRGF